MAASLTASASAWPGAAVARQRTYGPFERRLADIERALGARLGVAVIDTGSGRRWTRRATERFPMCSTFKVLASGAILARVDRGAERLDRRIVVQAADLVTYSPVTEKRVGGDGMALAELCEAAITRSDNTAGNLLLKSIGGPPGVTAFARTLGDGTTRLDRWETALNEATPGDPRDTTTPASMANDLHALVLGHRLSTRSRAQLMAWLVSNKTGDAKLRAGLPADWRVGDKTGGGDHGTMNDIAIVWPPARAPLVVCVFMTETSASFDDRNAAIAQIARHLSEEISA
jgi:beta-lactamase class A